MLSSDVKAAVFLIRRRFLCHSADGLSVKVLSVLSGFPSLPFIWMPALPKGPVFGSLVRSAVQDCRIAVNENIHVIVLDFYVNRLKPLDDRVSCRRCSLFDLFGIKNETNGITCYLRNELYALPRFKAIENRDVR